MALIRRRGPRTLAILLALFFAVMLPASAQTPSGYRKVYRSHVATSVEHYRLVGRQRAAVVNVASIGRRSAFELRAIPAMDRVGDGLERTSSICRRTKCLLGVNGDFWTRGTDVPIGGVISVGRLLRQPSAHHGQVTFTREGVLRTGPVRFTASLVSDDLRPLAIAAVNRPARGAEVVVFTPAFGRSTATPKGTVELAVRAVRPAGILVLDKTTVVRVAKHGSAGGNVAIPEDGAVLSAGRRGADRLRDLLSRMRSRTTTSEVLLRIGSDPNAIESLGGSPVLIRGGKAVPQTARTPFVDGRHPRTLIGWTRGRDVILVTVDGRQPRYSDGMTLAEATELMLSLGATEAINLDGGGSTTFVKRGLVVNRPSDRAVRSMRGRRIVHTAPDAPSTVGHVERPVAIALMLLPKKSKVGAVAPSALRELRIPEAPESNDTQVTDPASDPSGSTPELVYRYGRTWPVKAMAIGFVALGIAAAAAWTGFHHGFHHGKRHHMRARA